MFKIKLQSSITLLLCLIIGVAFADTMLPNHYPSNFDLSGTITKIDNKSRIIELDGADYKLHPVHDIYTTNKKSKITLYSLKPGMKIGGQFGTFQGKKALIKMWVLPKDYPTTPHAV